MTIYLDTCALQRPLDEKNQIRIAIEAEAVLGILSMCESGIVQLVSSDVLVFEVESNPNLTRKEYGFEALAIATVYVQLNPNIERRAEEFNKMGIKPLVALHLASADEVKVEYFSTCDDKFLKKAKELDDVDVKVVSLLEFMEEVKND